MDVLDEQKICGTDNRTYESLCRMILETDKVDVWFDEPCNRSDCQGTVSIKCMYIHTYIYVCALVWHAMFT